MLARTIGRYVCKIYCEIYLLNLLVDIFDWSIKVMFVRAIGRYVC